MSEGTRVVFLHIPKTGGTTLHHLLARKCRPETVWDQADPHLERHEAAQLSRFRLFSAHLDMARCRMVPAPKLLVTMMREPKDRILSVFYFWKAHRRYPDRHDLSAPRAARQMDLLTFLKSQDFGIPYAVDNPVTRLLTGATLESLSRNTLEEAKLALEDFHAIGIFEDFDVSIRTILTRLNIAPPKALPRLRASRDIRPDDPVMRQIPKEPVTKEIMTELRRLTYLDQELYEFAKVLSYDQITCRPTIAPPVIDWS